MQANRRPIAMNNSAKKTTDDITPQISPPRPLMPRALHYFS
jgi:hypothetical protein